MKTLPSILLSAAGLALVAGLVARAAETPKPAEPKAAAKIDAKSGSTVNGIATFSAAAGKVTLKLELRGATPGEHAVHLHEKGDCSAADATSAGGHWNPTSVNHGKWGTSPFHLGDIGNVKVGTDGTGELTLTTDKWTIGDGGPGDVVGKAVIVHAAIDDFKTQPTGNAGGRVGCGVIQTH
ncbi:MAG TPA: superoxide dismutase family protein [Candidatus Polarisedimenticolaceae bacterium]|nr:superoxide dismutase family protein [Candidatus Polarisedimenticolaceae bacterium]